MKVQRLALSALFALTIAPTMAFSASTTFTDDFWGGTAWGVNHADVLGGPSYALNSVSMNFSGTVLTIEIEGSYFNHIGQSGTTLGDLFISNNGWNPDPLGKSTQNYNGDYFENQTNSNGEQWEFALVLDKARYKTVDGKLVALTVGELGTSGSASLYSVNAANIIVSNNQPLTPTIYHAHQEVLYNTLGQNELTGAVANWSLLSDGAGGYSALRFIIDYSGFGFGTEDIGMHWTMTCGNDVVEGRLETDPVPEPGTIMLFGAGVAGLAGFGRRKK